MKSIIFLLLFVVVFLGGMLFGTKNSQEVVQVSPQQEIETVEEKKQVIVVPEREQERDTVTTTQISSDKKTMTEKVAKTLENTSIWVYDQVIHVAYSISELFI